MGWSQNLQVETRRVVVDGSGTYDGVFVYAGTPTAGNLVAALAEAAGTDPYGNAFDAGFTLFGTTFQTQSTPGTTRLKIDQYGEILGFNIYGAEVMHFDPGNGVYLIYQDLGSATQGSLISSIAVVPGTDAYGNAYLDGSTTYFPNATPVRACQNSNSLVTFYHASTMAGPWSQDGSIDSQSGTSGNDMRLSGGANGGDIYLGDVVGSVPITGTVSIDADLVTGTIAAFEPGVSNTAETWHPMTLLNGWALYSGGGGAYYRMNAQGDIDIYADLVPPASPNGTVIATLATGYNAPAAPESLEALIITSTGTPGVDSPRVYASSSPASLYASAIPSGTTRVIVRGTVWALP